MFGEDKMSRDEKDMRYGRKVLGILLMVGTVIFIMATINISYFFHLDALLLVAIGTIGYALAKNHNKSVFDNIGDGAVYFGWLGVLIAGIAIASDGFMSNNSEDLGPAVAMMLHPLFYGYFVRLITRVF